MAASVSDLLSASVALVGVKLLNNPDSIRSFTAAIDAEIETEQLISNLGVLPAGQQFMLHKDRISITITSDRSIVKQDYPNAGTLDRLSEIASLAIDSTRIMHATGALGYNIELVYIQDSGSPAATYIADRVFSAFDRNEGWQIAGGRAAFRFTDEGGAIWNVVLEPRRGDYSTNKVFLSINLHADAAPVPDREAISKGLGAACEAALAFVRLLDGSEVTAR